MAFVCHDYQVDPGIVEVNQALQKPRFIDSVHAGVVGVRYQLETVPLAKEKQQEAENNRRVRRDYDLRPPVLDSRDRSTDASQVSPQSSSITADLFECHSEPAGQRVAPQVATPVNPKKSLRLPTFRIYRLLTPLRFE